MINSAAVAAAAAVNILWEQCSNTAVASTPVIWYCIRISDVYYIKEEVSTDGIMSYAVVKRKNIKNICKNAANVFANVLFYM